MTRLQNVKSRPLLNLIFPAVIPAIVLAAFVLLLFYRLLFTNQVLANGDILHYFYPYRDYAAQAFRAGELPLWNPYIFMGVPFLANPQAAVLYPLHWPLNWLPVTKQIYWSAALHAWILGFGGFWLMRQLRFSTGAALTTAFVLAGSGFYGGLIGHINQMNGAAWLPWTLLIIERWRQRTAYWSAAVAWLGICVALMLLAGHTQTAYINLFGLGLWIIFPTLLGLLLLVLSGTGISGLQKLAKSTIVSTVLGKAAITEATGDKATQAETAEQPFQLGWKRLGSELAIYAGGVLLGGMLSLAQLLPTLELSELGLRQGGLSYADASSFSLNLLKLPFTLFPSYGLIDLSVTYGTLGYSEFVAYVGLSGLILIGIALWRANSSIRLWAILLAGAGLFLAIGRWNPAYWALYKVVPGFDLFRTPARWMMLYTVGMAILAGIGFEHGFRLHDRGRSLIRNRFIQIIVLSIIGLELILAARSLPHTQTTAPQAVTDVRTAVAHLLSDPQRQAVDPAAAGRFLSMSTITFDPGDMHAYRQILLGDEAEGTLPQIDERAFHQFVVALKSQEILAPNLSMLWRVPSVDGFDGGVLPLQRYIRGLSLFVAEDKVVPDGRLREQVTEVPNTRLLNLFNVAYVITDKVQDLWHEGVYYDREIGASLAAEPPGIQQITVDVPVPFEATRLDLIGAVIATKEITAEITAEAAEEATEEVTKALSGEAVAALQIGVDIPESGEHHGLRQANATASFELTVGGQSGAMWADNRLESSLAESSGSEVAYRDTENGLQEYVAHISFEEPITPAAISIQIAEEWREFLERLPEEVQPITLQLQAATLVDERTNMFQPLIVAGRGEMALAHSGDVKIYKNIDTLARSYLAYDVIGVEDAEEAFTVMQNRLSQPLSIGADDSQDQPIVDAGQAWATVEGLESFTAEPDQNDHVELVSYQPEKVELAVQNAEKALLVLSDSYYPGWRAAINDVDAEIYPVNGLFRGVLLPSGSHTVTFEYRPSSWRNGLWGSAGGGLLLGICFLVAIFRARDKSSNTENTFR